MTETEVKLLDEYIALDALCRDMYDTGKGVSSYIDEMTERADAGRALVDGWTADYAGLKHLRWMRNKIAHESGSTDCTMDDVVEVYRWHRRITEGSDPLTQLRLSEELQKRHRASFGTDSDNDSKSNPADFMIAAAGVIIGIIVIAAGMITG